jgi:CBS domain-containing protein
VRVFIPREGIEKLYEQARGNPVTDIMSRTVVTVTEEDSVEKVLELMLYRDLNRIPVVRDEVPIGIIARYDLLKMIAGKTYKP